MAYNENVGMYRQIKILWWQKVSVVDKEFKWVDFNCKVRTFLSDFCFRMEAAVEFRLLIAALIIRK